MSSPRVDPRPLIVGAGPTGLTAAFEFARRGVGCRIIDRLAERSPKPKGNCLQTRTLEVFDDLGLVDEILARGHRALFTCAYLDGEQHSRRSYAELDSSYPYVLWLAQVGIESFMEQRLAAMGVTVDREVDLTALTAGEASVVVELTGSGGSVERAEVQWLIACDGAHSVVRDQLGLDFEGDSYPGTWAMAEAAVDWDLPLVNEYTFFHGANTPFFCDPMPDGRFRLVTQSTVSDDEEVPAPTVEYFRQRMRDAEVPFRDLGDASFMDTYRIHHRAVVDLRQGRVFLAGDAAHIFSPIAGQGMNCGIQDAYNLAWKLALVIEGRAPDSLLDSYSAERIAADRAAMLLSDQETRRYTFHTDHDVDLRRQQFEAIADQVGILVSSFTLSEGAELTTNYRGSPIVDEPPAGGGEHQIQAGDRTPDVVGLTLGGGESVRLFDVTRTTRHVLLLLAGSDEPAGFDRLAAVGAELDRSYPELADVWIATVGQDPPTENASPSNRAWRWVGDPHGDLHGRFEASEATVCLIRPDGYVGVRCDLADCDRVLTAHLDRVYG